MLKTTLPLSFIVATRFFGLFIILPVISLYAMELKGANESLVGLLIGIYAFMQMLLQTPFGILSDKIGRKNSIAIGLLIFIIGSFVCAYANDIYVMIFGRFLQGCGAVGAIAIALISDFTKEENRTKQKKRSAHTDSGPADAFADMNSLQPAYCLEGAVKELTCSLATEITQSRRALRFSLSR